MAARRMLKDWTNSDKVEQLGPQAEVFFTRLIMKADDFGCFWADAKRLKANLFPIKSDTRETDISRWKAECQKAGLIVVYVSDEKEYLQILDFDQRLRTKKAKFPQPAGYNPGFRDGGYVYLIGSSILRPVKVGFSLNPWARVKELSTGNNEALSVLMTFPGSKSHEKAIQQLLKENRVKNEWFAIAGPLKILFEEAFEEKKTGEELLSTLRNYYVGDRSSPEVELEVELEDEHEVELEEKEKEPHADIKNSNLFRKPVIPSFEKVHEVFVMSGGTKEMSEKFYQKHESTGWYLNGSPIVNYSALIPKFIMHWKQNETKKGKNETSVPKVGRDIEFDQP